MSSLIVATSQQARRVCTNVRQLVLNFISPRCNIPLSSPAGCEAHTPRSFSQDYFTPTYVHTHSALMYTPLLLSLFIFSRNEGEQLQVPFTAWF